MDIYLAGPWARREEVKQARDIIHATSQHRVVSRWLDHIVTNLPNEQADEAQHDLDDMDASKALIVMNLQKSEGKSFEQGYMFAQRKPIVIVGERSHVFQHLPRVAVVPSLHAALGVLNIIEAARSRAL